MKNANAIDPDLEAHTDSRLTELEIKASFIEDTLDRLNDVIVRQQQQIDRLLAGFAALCEHRDGADVIGMRSARDEQPPHY